MTVPDYMTYLDVQQTINLELVRLFAAEGIEFAYPTQHLFVETVGPTGPPAVPPEVTGAADSVDDPGDDA